MPPDVPLPHTPAAPPPSQGRPGVRRPRPWGRGTRLALLALSLPLLFLLLDRLFPPPLPQGGAAFGVVVADRHGQPLRAFADARGVWRFPTRPEAVSPRYREALLTYEDRWFHHHPGINPLALLRAAWQNLRAGRVISGGSTLTMQVARLLEPHPRTLAGKLRQMFRAVQLEWRLDKGAILTLYLNHAPFGGPVAGVEAAARTHLGHSARVMTHAEAALLAVLPQAPSRLRPDRHPEAARAARDKVLARLQALGVWSRETVAAALREPLPREFQPPPPHAPLLARRLKAEAAPGGVVATTIDAPLQRRVEALVHGYRAGLPPRASLAVVVAEAATMAARAYVGSAEFASRQRFGHVDMVTAVRSPGSTLKPFLYGLAIDQGLIHSESLLLDLPGDFGGYRPGNFLGNFHGPVSAAEALARSLNLPAVDLLSRMGPETLAAHLEQGGLTLRFPPGAGPNLALILGGAGTTLEQLVGAYGALVRGGMAARLRLTPAAPLVERRLLSPGAAWMVRTMLADRARGDWAGAAGPVAAGREVAWKTGTSYGYRDAWAVGVTNRHVIGVWVGRPDGTPQPGHYGAVTAAPLLFRLVDAVAREPAPVLDTVRPASVTAATICWPTGTPPQAGREALCHQRRQAWILDGAIPPTLPEPGENGGQGWVVRYWVNPESGLRVDDACPVARREPRELARWPRGTEPWLTPELRRRSRPPATDPACPAPAGGLTPGVRLAGLADGVVVRPAGATGEDPLVTLTANGGDGPLHWLVDGLLVGSTPSGAPFRHRFDTPGPHRITVMDQRGRFDSISLTVAP